MYTLFIYLYAAVGVMEKWYDMNEGPRSRRIQHRPTLQLAVVQVELFGHLSPTLHVEKVVSASFVRGRFL